MFLKFGIISWVKKFFGLDFYFAGYDFLFFVLGVATAWTIWVRSENEIYLTTSLGKETYCPFAGRRHLSNRIWFKTNVVTGNTVVRCHDTSCRRRESAPLTRIFPGRDSQLRVSSTSFGTTEKKNKKQEKNTIRKDISLAPSTLHQFEKVCVHVGIICKYFVLEKE